MLSVSLISELLLQRTKSQLL